MSSLRSFATVEPIRDFSTHHTEAGRPIFSPVLETLRRTALGVSRDQTRRRPLPDWWPTIWPRPQEFTVQTWDLLSTQLWIEHLVRHPNIAISFDQLQVLTGGNLKLRNLKYFSNAWSALGLHYTGRSGDTQFFYNPALVQTAIGFEPTRFTV